LDAFVMAMSLSGLGHAAEEAVEAAVHVADTGHGPHAEHHPEGEAERGTEHYCFGSVHTCGCCPTAVAAATHSTLMPVRAARHVGHAVDDDDLPADGIRKRIDRPPRA
jgi:hypothetical protein